MQHPFPVYHSSRRENKRNIKSKDNKMFNFQDLPDELVLKVLSYSKTKDLISCGQVSKRIRRISHDSTLWRTANLEKKIVKTEFLEMILGKGCRILHLCHSTILGHLSSNIKSQLCVLKWSRSVCKCDMNCGCDEHISVLEQLLFSSCSLQHLVMERVYLTPKMAVSICKNGKTLQTLNLNSSFLDNLTNDNSLDSTPAYNYFQEMIKCCQELKEVDLAYLNDAYGLTDDDLHFVVKNIPTNVQKLNLSRCCIKDDHVKILVRRCNKIKTLNLEPTLITDDSLTNIRQHLNLTLEELSLGSNDGLGTIHYVLANPMSNIFRNLFEVNSMQRLKILNLCYENDDGEEIQNLRQHLPHLMIKGVLN